MRSEWREVVVADICSYRQERVDVETLTESSYVSTANMVPNRGGIEIAEKLPNTTTTSRFISGDVLISNIRPYFKKSWLASKDGGCSNDVLVMQAKDGIDTSYLYYLLSSDDFFAYMTATSKGTKMPRGDKDAIMKYEVKIPPLAAQKIIAKTLSCLDAKIELNNKINENLEAQAQAIFKNWFVDFDPFQDGAFVESEMGLIPEGWSVSALADAIDVNPARILKKGSLATHLDMANVPTSGSRALSWKQREFTSGTRFTNGDVLVARITPCLENGKTAFVDFLSDGEIGWGSTEFIVMRSREPWPVEYAYCLARYEPFRAHLIGSMTGTSGRQRVQIDALKRYLVATANDAEIYTEFGEIVSPLFASIRQRAEENQTLAALRDTLLPKLMSGEIEVPVD